MFGRIRKTKKVLREARYCKSICNGRTKEINAVRRCGTF